MKKSQLVLSLWQRLMLLLFIFIVCYALTAVLALIIGKVLSHNPAAAMRISTVLQDVLCFIVPAIATVLVVTRRPAELLCIQDPPSPRLIILVGIILFVSIPLEENIIYWNYNIQVPAWADDFAAFARHMEEVSFESTKILLANASVGGLILNILLIGVAAGFSEELLFRGCFQRLLTTGGVNRHVAVWTVAIVFSAMHFQFFGFVPRMLLGAYFGYLLLWSGNLWLSVTAHILNNTMYVIVAWNEVRLGHELTSEPMLYSTPLAIASGVMITLVLIDIYTRTRREIRD